MTATDQRVFEDLVVDHVQLYVHDVARTRTWLGRYGFEVFAASREAGGARSLGLGRNRIRLVVTEPLTGDHPGAAYVDRHGDGVGDIALRVDDAGAAFAESVRRGARPVRAPVRDGGTVTTTIMAFGDVTHTFVERVATADDRVLPGLRPVAGGAPAPGPELVEVDHFAVCLEPGQLAPTVEFYQRVLDFDMIFTERIRVGAQAMNSSVVQSRSGRVTLTLIEPDPAREPGQIDEFLKNHGGPGVQHVAFTTDDIVDAVGHLEAGGVEFLRTPDAYYDLIGRRLEPARHPVAALRERHVLVDADQYGQLFQIFARSVHPRRTFFTEIIERAGARTFGSANIRALYEAVDVERLGGHPDP